jgi:hypothetical protein
MSEQMRKEFEDWAEKHGYLLKVIAQQDGLGTEIYANGQTRSAWLGWQASRQSLVVKLPLKDNGKEFLSVEYCGNTFVKEQSVIDALDAAGVSYE